MMLFHNHQPETQEQQIKRVSEKISKILKSENLTFDVQMIPQIRIVPQPKDEKTEMPTQTK